MVIIHNLFLCAHMPKMRDFGNFFLEMGNPNHYNVSIGTYMI